MSAPALSADDLRVALQALEAADFKGRDAAAVVALLGRFRAAYDAARKPTIAAPEALRTAG